jgi:hypothetical protein
VARRRRRGRGSRCAGSIQAQQARRSQTDAQASEEVRLRPQAVGHGRLAIIWRSGPRSRPRALHERGRWRNNRGPRIRISQPDDGSARCNASRALALRRNSSQPTPPCTTSSTSNAISYQLNRAACYAPLRGPRGARSLRPLEVPHSNPASRRSFDNVSTPVRLITDLGAVAIDPTMGRCDRCAYRRRAAIP